MICYATQQKIATYHWLRVRREKMKKILIIDDDRPLAELLGMFLTTFGYPPPVYAGDGNDGLFVLIQENIGVIFTDLEMPNMDGETFIKNYRNSTQAFAR